MTTYHASAVLIGPTGVLIRGPSGAGKSRLALALIQASRTGALPFGRLIGDDRVRLAAAHRRLLVSPAQGLESLIEIRGVGIRRMAYEAVARVGLVIDLGQSGVERMPPAGDAVTAIEGVSLPRLAVASGDDALATLLSYLGTQPAGN